MYSIRGCEGAVYLNPLSWLVRCMSLLSTVVQRAKCIEKFATSECQEPIVIGYSDLANHLLDLLFGLYAVLCKYITELLESSSRLLSCC